MDTKSKNSNSDSQTTDLKNVKLVNLKDINLFSKLFKIIIIALIYILTILYILNYQYLSSQEHIADRRIFNNEFDNYCFYVVESKLNLQNESHIEEVYQKRFDNDNSNNQITKIVENRTSDLKAINASLNKIVNFVYVITDTNGKIEYTNVENNPNIELNLDSQRNNFNYTYMGNQFDNPINILKQQKYYSSIINGVSINPAIPPRSAIDLISELDIGDKYEFHFAVIEPITVNLSSLYEDEFYTWNLRAISSAQKHKIANIVNKIIILILVALIIIFSLLAGKNSKEAKVKLNIIDYISVEITTVCTFILILILYTFADFLYQNFLYQYQAPYADILRFILAVIVISIILVYVCSITRQIKAKVILKNSLYYKAVIYIQYFVSCIKEIYKSERRYKMILFSVTLLIFIAVNGFCYLVLFIELIKSPLPHYILATLLISIVVANLLFVIWIIRFLIGIEKINKATYMILNGNIDYHIDKSFFTDNIKYLADNISNIQNGLNKALNQAIKDEHLKTELITNVSHDLKTPLTSIINYIDLLKKEPLDNDKAYNYLNILDEKSNRLKQLIEDLIEASKISSRNIPVTLEKLDLQQLILQSYGEYEEKLSKNDLDIRINSNENQIMVYADGKHMWRIISNLLSNISKYTLDNSRVYIDISKDEYYALVSIKNISAYELNITPENLTERFVRGDTSRTTDGSGLGLSIAKNLTEIQGGDFKIQIDGDLFKVSIKIPLYK